MLFWTKLFSTYKTVILRGIFPTSQEPCGPFAKKRSEKSLKSLKVKIKANDGLLGPSCPRWLGFTGFPPHPQHSTLSPPPHPMLKKPTAKRKGSESCTYQGKWSFTDYGFSRHFMSFTLDFCFLGFGKFLFLWAPSFIEMRKGERGPDISEMLSTLRCWEWGCFLSAVILQWGRTRSGEVGQEVSGLNLWACQNLVHSVT